MSELRFRTLAFDSAGDLARLYFSFDMKKHGAYQFTPGGDVQEAIRQFNNYPGAIERLNMLVRRLKSFRKAGMDIVFQHTRTWRSSISKAQVSQRKVSQPKSLMRSRAGRISQARERQTSSVERWITSSTSDASTANLTG